MGAAVLAGFAAGIFRDPAEAVHTHLKIEKVYEPNSKNRKRFNERYELYKNLYPAVKKINHQL